MHDELSHIDGHIGLREPRGAFYDNRPWRACPFTSSIKPMSIDWWPKILKPNGISRGISAIS